MYLVGTLLKGEWISLMDNPSIVREDSLDEASVSATRDTVLSRRDVLKTAAAGVLVSLPLLQSSANAADTWTPAGKSGTFVKGVPQLVVVNVTEALYITRTDTGLTAVSAKCTHRGCELAWTAADTQFECPCHGAAFKSDGTNVHGTRRNPAEALSALLSVPVRERGGNVEVNLTNISADLITPKQG